MIDNDVLAVAASAQGIVKKLGISVVNFNRFVDSSDYMLNLSRYASDRFLQVIAAVFQL